jgi:hypothetical protein
MSKQPDIFRNRAIQAVVVVAIPILIPEHILGKGKAT